MLTLFSTVLSKAPRRGLALFFNERLKEKKNKAKANKVLYSLESFCLINKAKATYTRRQFHDTASQCCSVRLSNLRLQVHRFQVLFVLLFSVLLLLFSFFCINVSTNFTWPVTCTSKLGNSLYYLFWKKLDFIAAKSNLVFWTEEKLNLCLLWPFFFFSFFLL